MNHRPPKGTAMTKTIDPRHAADLYDLFDDHGEVDEDQSAASDRHGWTVLGSTPSRTSRWHERYWMVLRNEAGELWGIEYGLGLTENQEDDLPWDGAVKPLPLTRLEAHEVTTVEYRAVKA